MGISSNNSSKLRALVECALLIAIGTILAQIKIFRMPAGGSITAASMVPFLLVSYRHGTKWGLLASFANVLLQVFLGGIYPPVAPGALGYFAEVLLDYFLAYIALGFSYAFFKWFKEKHPLLGVGLSTALCCLLRFICAFVSGFLVWSDVASEGMLAITYSLSYNASYMVPESVITIVVMCVLYKTAPKLFNKQA